jgi:class 3 adenylate cyclase/pimeloyl-ACP methyl ester carboxylesterase
VEVTTGYAPSRGAHIAYQVVGDGPVDLLFVHSFMSNIELGWEHPAMSAFYRRLARFSRLIQFDRRGNGMSDRSGRPSTLEEQVDDVRAVLAAVGSREPAVMAINEGAGLALLFAASHPESVRALVLGAPVPRLVSGPGYEWAQSAAERAERIKVLVERWGQPTTENPWVAMGGLEPHERAAMARYQRLAAGPGDAGAMMVLAGESDVREALGSIQCPTLVIRRREDEMIDERHSRYVAEHIAGARYMELPGSGQVWVGDVEEPGREIEAFLTGARPPAPSERVLATVLFTDIVASTELAARLGDGRWSELLRSHDGLVRGEVERQRGRLVKSLGDGALAVFDGPSRALAAAVAIRDGVRGLGVQVRVGVHTGECELVGEDLGGIAVHIGARVAALAEPDQVLATRTVRDLTVGAPFALDDCGERTLKGIDGPWQLFAVEPAGPVPPNIG